MYKFKDELHFLFITSKVILLKDKKISITAIKTDILGLYIDIQESREKKCLRCWHRRADVNSVLKYPNICTRCVKNLNTGKTRLVLT